MSHQLFILPTSEVAMRHPKWMLAMEELQLPWEQFISLVIDNILDHVNRGGIEDISPDNLDSYEASECADTILDSFLTVDGEMYHRYFTAVSAVAMDLITMVYTYLPKVIATHTHRGVPSGVRLYRVIGYDLSLEVQYLDLGGYRAFPAVQPLLALS